jgi:RecA/RadA recombinase
VIARDLLLARRKPVGEGALSTGSTLLNLACTDRADCGYLKGAYYYLVGDSVSGKTWLSLSCFAEACRSPAFKDYRLIYDDVEGGALMDIAHYFGKDVARRLEPPSLRKGRPVYSETIESFYYHLADLIKEGRPFIYVLDSQDALTSKAAAKKFAVQKKASEEGEDAKGSYGDGKAKYHSENLRHVLAGLRRTKSILLVIGQTRDNLGFGFETKTRAGGRALRFYANLEIWTSVAGKILRTVRGKPRTVGARCLAEVRKNRLTGKVGKDRAVQIPIYYGLGIDDVGSCVDFLIAEKHWKKNENKEIDAKEILFTGSRAAVIAHIEEEGLEQKIIELTGTVWREVETECLPGRKRRYE